jgi:competence protein ComEA
MKKIKRVSSIIFIGLLVVLYLVPAIANTEKVNINTADKVQLMTLKYIGEKIAEKIIEYRTTQPFEVPEDIMKVNGVGQKIFDANKDRIIVKTE